MSKKYQGSSVSSYGGLQSAKLGRLTILHETKTFGFKGEIRALFNPNKISFSGSTTVQKPGVASAKSEGKAEGTENYVFQPTTLTISLLFDTSEKSGDDANVLKHTTKVAALIKPIPDTSRPPLCELWWGQYILLKGVLTSLTQEFTLFRPDGTPVRATLGCTFTEQDKSEIKLTLGTGAGSRFYLVGLGETLQTIASKVYGDTNRWRDIALYNSISNPRLLFPGRLLLLPL